MGRITSIAVVTLFLLVAVAALFFLLSFGVFTIEKTGNEVDPWELGRAFAYYGIGASDRDLDDSLLHQRTILISTYTIHPGVAGTVVRRLLYLNALDPEQSINLLVNTGGGSWDPTFAIVGAMRSIDAPVNTICLGSCLSAGTLLVVAGTGQRAALPSSTMQVHATFADDSGPFSSQSRFRALVEGLYRERSTLPGEWFPLKEDSRYTLSPTQALEFGMIDTIVERIPGSEASRKPLELPPNRGAEPARGARAH